jgi:hypothetical protein
MLCAAFLLGARCIMIPYRLMAMSSTLPLAAALAGLAPRVELERLLPGDQRLILSALPVR